MTFMDVLYEKTKGAFWGLLFLIFGFVGLVISYIIAYLETGFMFYKNYMSDLSAIPNGPSTIFIIWIVSIGLILIPFNLYYTKFMLEVRQSKKALTYSYLALMLIYSVLSIIMTIFPLNTNEPTRTIHLSVAIAIFTIGGIALFLISIVEIIAKDVPLSLPIIGFLVTVFSIIFAILLFIVSFTSLEPNLTFTYISEWIAFVLIYIWFIIHTIYLFRIENLELHKNEKVKNEI